MTRTAKQKAEMFGALAKQWILDGSPAEAKAYAIQAAHWANIALSAKEAL